MWGKGEPDRLANEGCVSHTVDGTWQDVPCQMQLGFVCEINFSKYFSFSRHKYICDSNILNFKYQLSL